MTKPPNDTPPPYDEAAEAGALGSILLANGDGRGRKFISQLVFEDFYDLRHQMIYCALTVCEHNLVSLIAYLSDYRHAEAAGGLDYVSTLPEKSPSAENFPFFLERLKDKAARRAALRDSIELAALANDSTIPAKALADAARRMGEAHSANVKRGLTLRKPSEFLSMEFDDSDNILGDHLIALGQPAVIVGAGGLGKSRLFFQLAGAVVTGRKFLCFDTRGADLRFLILQDENSNRRLQADLKHTQEWLGEDWPRFDSQVVVHALETEADSFVSLDNPENCRNIEAAINEAKPDVIAIDPLNDFAIGDLNKDADMKLTLQTLSRICRKGNPNRAIVTLHHALTGRTGAAKATGFDRSSFGRNSKTLFAWTRGQINLAPVDAENNDRLIVACGKCSNGREFPTFAIRLNPETMIYECDPSVDVAAWEKEITGKADKEPLMNPDRVRELCSGPMTKQELAKAVIEDCGCYRGSAYRYITRAEQAGKIRFSKTHETYSKR